MNRSIVVVAGASRYVRVGACLLLLCAAAVSGCDSPMPPNMVLQEYHTPATGPFQATGWTDANGKPVSADDELAAKTRCAQRIVEASTDQIHNVPARDIDDCLLRMGWKKGAK